MTIADLLTPPQTANDIFDAVRALLLENGRQKTWEHVSAVADVCAEIGESFGIPSEACRAAGLLHDISAVVPAAEMMAYAESQGWTIDPAERAHPFLLHQRVSEAAARTRFGVTDETVLTAIRCHTTLRANPSSCDMALFLADKLAWDQPGEPPFRSEIERGLTVSLEQACLNYIEYAMAHGMILTPHQWLLDALEWLKTATKNVDKA